MLRTSVEFAPRFEGMIDGDVKTFTNKSEAWRMAESIHIVMQDVDKQERTQKTGPGYNKQPRPNSYDRLKVAKNKLDDKSGSHLVRDILVKPPKVATPHQRRTRTAAQVQRQRCARAREEQLQAEGRAWVWEN